MYIPRRHVLVAIRLRQIQTNARVRARARAHTRAAQVHPRSDPVAADPRATGSMRLAATGDEHDFVPSRVRTVLWRSARTRECLLVP